MEDDPLRGRTRDARPDCRVAARSVALSVPDLEKSKRFFIGALGMTESTAALRRPEHEALWGLDGATTRSVALDAGRRRRRLAKWKLPEDAGSGRSMHSSRQDSFRSDRKRRTGADRHPGQIRVVTIEPGHYPAAPSLACRPARQRLQRR